MKLFLNSLIKKGDEIANMYRLILEAENHNINAKKYRNTSSFSYKDEYYAKKRKTIEELIRLIIEYNKTHSEKVVFGKQNSNVRETNLIVYFDLPGCEQISFHTDITSALLKDVPKYEKDWDGKVNSTLRKVEAAVNARYKEELYKKYKKEIEESLEAERKEKERLEQIRKQREEQLKKEEERKNDLKSKIKRGASWREIRDIVFKKDKQLIQDTLKSVDPKIREAFEQSYIESLKIDKVETEGDLDKVLRQYIEVSKSTLNDFLGLAKRIEQELIDNITKTVAILNDGAVEDTGDMKMYLVGEKRYIISGISGKYTVFFNSAHEPSELSKTCYKRITKKKAKHLGNSKMPLEIYLKTQK